LTNSLGEFQPLFGSKKSNLSHNEANSKLLLGWTCFKGNEQGEFTKVFCNDAISVQRAVATKICKILFQPFSLNDTSLLNHPTNSSVKPMIPH